MQSFVTCLEEVSRVIDTSPDIKCAKRYWGFRVSEYPSIVTLQYDVNETQKAVVHHLGGC